MKKLLYFLVAGLLSFTAVQAQKSSLVIFTSDQTVHKLGLDTANNAANVNQVVQIPGWVDQITVQAAVTKLTGTPAGGLRLYGSVDGVRYDFVTATTDTLAVANITGKQVKTWVVSPSKFQYYKVRYLSTGTQTSTLTTTALLRTK